MKLLFHIAIHLITMFGVYANSENDQYFKENIVMTFQKCTSTLVRMDGISQLNTLNAPDNSLMTLCNVNTKNKGNLSCKHFDITGKNPILLESTENKGQIIYSDAVIQDESHTFILNMVTNNIMAIINLRVLDGKALGRKICNGKWLYESQMNKK